MDLNEISFTFYNESNNFEIECNHINALRCLSQGIDKIIKNYNYKDTIDIEINNNLICVMTCDFPLEKILLFGIDEFIENTKKEN